MGGEEVTDIAKKIANRAGEIEERRACGLESEYKQVARRDPSVGGLSSQPKERADYTTTTRGEKERDTRAQRDTRAYTRITGIVIQSSPFEFFRVHYFRLLFFSFFATFSSSSTGALSSKRKTLKVADGRRRE